jgi:hypothetical protein
LIGQTYAFEGRWPAPSDDGDRSTTQPMAPHRLHQQRTNTRHDLILRASTDRSLDDTPPRDVVEGDGH